VPLANVSAGPNPKDVPSRSIEFDVPSPGAEGPFDDPGSVAWERGPLLVGRKVPILLDNARDPAQVRPLLPGAPGCLVLVTAATRSPAGSRCPYLRGHPAPEVTGRSNPARAG
jgi:hypothetical protein